MNRLKNPACFKKGASQDFCGMCNLEETDKREIKKTSLFGECRRRGKCIDGQCYNAAQNTKGRYLVIEINEFIADEIGWFNVKSDAEKIVKEATTGERQIISITEYRRNKALQKWVEEGIYPYDVIIDE